MPDSICFLLCNPGWDLHLIDNVIKKERNRGAEKYCEVNSFNPQYPVQDEAELLKK